MEQLQIYIARSIINYFAGESESVTSRYVLYFDSLENIISFEKKIEKILSVEYLKKDLIARIGGNASLDVILDSPFQFYNDDGGLEYEAIQIRVKNGTINRRIVFVPDCDEKEVLLGDAFKNKIRNKFVDQQEEGILFYLSVQNIASVSKTTENFQKQGMPLSIANVYGNLKSQISIIQGENQQKVVLYALEKIIKNKSQSDTSLLGFAPIIRIIETKMLGPDDFHDLHMFQMTLTDLGKKDCLLAENYKLFRDISFALSDQELDTIMSSYEPKIVQEIKKAFDRDEEKWDKNISFEYIQKSKKVNQKKFKLDGPIMVVDAEENELEHDYYLDFLKSTTASYVIFTKDFPREKNFAIKVKFTQKANVKSDDFVVEKQNSKETAHKILIDGNKYIKNGTVIFEGGKEGKFTILISVINVRQSFFVDTCVGFTKKGAKYLYQLTATDYMIHLGGGFGDVTLNVQFKSDLAPILVNSDNNTKIKFTFAEGESAKEHVVSFNLDDNSATFDASIKFEETKQKVLELYELFNKCMLNSDSFYVEEGKLLNKHKHSEKYSTEEFDVAGKKYEISTLLELEKELIAKKYKHVKVTGLKSPIEVDCKIPDDVTGCYENICQYYSKLGTTPSMSTINKDLLTLYQNYIGVVLKYIGKSSNGFQDKQKLAGEIYQLFKLGLVEDSDGLIWITPLNPLSVAYQLELSDLKNKWVKLDSYLYGSLGFGNMLPFITDAEDNIYQAIKGNYPIQWACYCDASQSVKGDANTYSQKIEDYYLKFNYLFDGVYNKNFIVNIIGIKHTSEVIRALLKLFVSKNIDPANFYMEINYYFKGTGKNDFDNMTEYDYIYSVAQRYYGNKNSDSIEGFCDWYIEHVKYYAKIDDGKYGYSHITFCAFQNEKKAALSNTISDSKSGIMLNGLISDIPSSLDQESGIYKYGFGAQYTSDLLADSEFVQLAYSYNELARCKEGSPASRDTSIAQGVQNTKSDKLEAIYKASNWVVFVEPKIDLDFFIEQDDSGDEDLIIIHYPDKNVTSAGYTSITVTQKSEQYINVIKEYLQEKIPFISRDINVKRIIKNFNAYSGEWLMNFINNKQVEEKVSLVSAIGFCINYFNNVYPEYTWVPVALDEVLRVTGSIGGTLTNVLFSKKVLINRGIIQSQNATSDDLLMAGVKVVNDRVHVTYIPIEVKHGNCDSKTKNDAHNQVCNTAQLLRSSFLDSEDMEHKQIDKKIYRNYMIQHVISNAEKMLSYQIVDSAEYTKLIASIIRSALFNDDYDLDISKATDLYAFYFVEGQNAVTKQKNSNDGVIEIAVPMIDMYHYLVDDSLLDNDVLSLVGGTMQSDTTQYEINVVDEEDAAEEEDGDAGDRESENLEGELAKINDVSDVQDSIQEIENVHVATSVSKNKFQEARVLIGQDIAKNKIYWEFGNKQLANRHLLITGTSGQGKTYSIQTMLYELTKSGVSSVIFDYTEGFMKTQLEKPFVDNLGDQISEKIVYSTGVPINPFVSHEIDIAGTVVKEKPALVASRLADIFSHVYDFGEQQYSAIFSAVLNGINHYGENMSMGYFQQELEEVQETNKAAKTVISKMEPFFQTISFEESDDFDWGEVLYNEKPTVNIFQLTLINREMQVIITELMLWDAWYYTKKFGNKDKPFVVVLDEAQNLSHKSNSPSAAILKEGRKFGWSAWFATQSLKILKDEEVVNLSQAAFKLYFKPTDDEITKIAKLLDPTGDINWTGDVKSLQKGQCIVVGSRTSASGVFGATQPTVVSVSPFEERK
jgi:DNA phosphorothioation-dependent restriction protein DptH